MKVNVTEKILGIKGDEYNVFKNYVVLKEGSNELLKDEATGQVLFYEDKTLGSPLTLRDVCVEALSVKKEDAKLKDSFKLMELAKRIYDNDEVELDTDSEIPNIIKGLEQLKHYNNFILGYVWKLLQGK